MNLAQLYAKLLTALSENATPQYWSEAELKGYINEGLREFVKRSKFLRKNVFLDKSNLEDGVYFLPTDIIEPVGVQYLGKPLDKKSLKFLEAAYSGTSHQRVLSGPGRSFNKSWREVVGEPIHWFFENQMVKVFPKPDFLVGKNSSNSLIKKISAVLYEQNNKIQLPIPLPYINQNLVDVYINGIYQNIDQWSISPADSSILLLPYTAQFTAQVEVVFQNSAIIAAKHGQAVVAGQHTFTFQNCLFDDTADSLKVVHDGVTLTSSDFTGSVPIQTVLQITLTVPALSNGVIEVTVYTPLTPLDASNIAPNRIADQSVSMDYIYLPEQLADSDDEPEIPLAFHDACWQWAAFQALTKEGAKTQDVKKSIVYLEAFERSIAASQAFVDSEIDIDLMAQMPWRL